MEKISQHISYNEATKSNTATRLGIDNKPNAEQLANMIVASGCIFEALREHFVVPVGISSFFRCDALNTAINGASTSQHMKGQALDIDADIYGKITNQDIFNYIKDNLDYDQLIAEGIKEDGSVAWVHVSYVSKEQNRNEALLMSTTTGKTKYYVYDATKGTSILNYA